MQVSHLIDAGAILEVGAVVVQMVAVAVAALGIEAAGADGRGGFALLGAQPGEEALEVGAHLGLPGPRLEAHEVGNGDGGQDADDGHHDHQLDQGKAVAVTSRRHGSSPRVGCM
jgi:hypothetical protein